METGGRRTPPTERRVEAMFDSIVERYDLLNRLLSLGLDRRWRRTTARALIVGHGGRVLDLGCGTAALGLELAERAKVVGLDVSVGMLRVARRRAVGRLALVRGSAFRLPFRDGTFEGVASAFVLRNLADLPAAFSELGRVAAPGCGLAIVDITGPVGKVFGALFRGYFRVAAPALGRLGGHPEAYRYLVRSVAHLPPPAEVSSMLRSAGFVDCVARPLTGGTVTLFTARRERQ